MDNKLDLSVAIITFNEEKRLGATLESICDIASEIVVIDSFSQDKTVEIAKEYNAKVFQEQWKGFVEQKNSLTSKCSHSFILYLDADEVISNELKQEIIKAVNSPYADGYYLHRKTHYLGKLLNFAWQKDERLRLVKKSAEPLWKGEIVHEELFINGKTSLLNGYIIHYSYKDMKDHFAKTINYAYLSAKSYYKKGKKPSISKLIFSPFFSFFKLYILKRGFLDGIRGLIAGFSAYVYVFLKYAFLWEMYLNNKEQD